MRKLIIIFFIIIGVPIFLVGVNMYSKIQKGKMKIISESSYYSDYSVEGNKVLIKCSITLKSTYKLDKTVQFSANMKDDVTIGLLKQAKIYALNDDGTKAEYRIKGNKQVTYDVVFVGEYAGTNNKHDRLLPQITIEIIKDKYR